jgi:hypothetical protein
MAFGLTGHIRLFYKNSNSSWRKIENVAIVLTTAITPFLPDLMPAALPAASQTEHPNCKKCADALYMAKMNSHAQSCAEFFLPAKYSTQHTERMGL